MALVDDIKKGTKDLGTKAVEVGKEIADFASDSLEVGKLLLSIQREKGKINDVKDEMVKYVMDACENGSMTDETLNGLYKKIEEVNNNIKEMNAKIEEIRKNDNEAENTEVKEETEETK